MKPTEAAKAIEAALPFKFTSGLFTNRGKAGRASAGWICPSRADERQVLLLRRAINEDYGYTPAYVAEDRPGNATRNKSVEVSWTQRRETKETGAWVGEPPPRPPWAKKKMSSDGDHEDSFSILSGLANDTGPSVLTHGL